VPHPGSGVPDQLGLSLNSLGDPTRGTPHDSVPRDHVLLVLAVLETLHQCSGLHLHQPRLCPACSPWPCSTWGSPVQSCSQLRMHSSWSRLHPSLVNILHLGQELVQGSHSHRQLRPWPPRCSRSQPSEGQQSSAFCLPALSEARSCVAPPLSCPSEEHVLCVSAWFGAAVSGV
jgi:hypothetical protein